MAWLTGLRVAVRSLVARRLVDARLDAELQYHVEQLTDEKIRAGMAPDDARRAALIAVGSPARVIEEVRELSAWIWWEHLRQDVRYALRAFRGHPGFTLTAVLSLALGIGANATVFTVLDAALLRSLPVDRPDQLVLLNPGSDFSYPDYVALRDGSPVFADLLGASRAVNLTIAVDGAAEPAFIKIVSGNYFSALGLRASAGRLLTSADDRETAAVISHRFWSTRFGGSPTILGRPIAVDGMAFTIVGVAPRGFFSDAPGEAPDVWTTLAFQTSTRLNSRGYSWLNLLGRLRPGLGRQQAEAALNAQLAGAPADGLRRVELVPGGRGVAGLRLTFANPLYVLMAVVGLVLIVACTNLGSLMLTRAAARESEIAMRLAIGASRGRIVRQLLTESLLLGAAGAAAGLTLAAWGSRALLRLASASGRPVVLDVGLDLRILSFTAVVSLAAVALFGLAPAFRAVSSAETVGPIPTSHGIVGPPTRWGLRDLFIVAQLALSLVLLATGALFVRTIGNLQRQDLGYRSDDVTRIELQPARDYRPVAATLVPRLLERVSAIPGVAVATVSFNGTLTLGSGVNGLQVDGFVPRSPDDQRARADWVGPDYFRTVGITLLGGRDFSSADTAASQKVAIVNETMARHFFGDTGVVGRRFTFNRNPYEIVGVVKDVKYTDLRQAPPRMAYFALMQGGAGLSALEVRSAGVQPSSIATAIRTAVAEIDSRLTVRDITTVSMRIRRQLFREHLLADLAGFFSLLTLLLASIGVYGTLAYTAARRTREIGIRLALGSGRGAVIWMVLRAIVARLALGLLVGLAGMLVLGRLIASMLFGLQPTDPATIALAAATLMIAAIGAGFLPAIRASRLDVAAVLRE